MAVETLRLSDLAAMSDEERYKRLAAFVAGSTAPLNGEKADLDAKIAHLERRYEMSSQAMKVKFDAGSISETEDICYWLMLLSIREELAR